jgi:positive regulator of sigma E activity
VTFTLIGIACGISSLLGDESASKKVVHGDALEIKIAKASSLGNWIWAFCSPVIGLFFGFLIVSLIWFSHYLSAIFLKKPIQHSN